MTKNKKSPIKQKRSRNRLSYIAWLNKGLFLLLLGLCVCFAANINDLSIKAFVLRDLHAEAAQVARENEEIELMVMRLESYEHIARRAQELDMVKVDRIDYLQALEPEVAKR